MEKAKVLKTIQDLILTLDGERISNERLDSLIGSLYASIDSILPKYLYKFRSDDERHINAFEEDKLYLSNPSWFNDPEECISHMDPVALEYYASMALKTASEARESLRIGKELSKVQWDAISEHLKLSNVALETIRIIQDRFKILCFSEAIDNTLMWSHYSNGHKGFALRYKVSEISITNCQHCSGENRWTCHRPDKPLFPVLYSKEKYDATKQAFARALYIWNNNWIDNKDYPVPFMPVLQKDYDWRYEKEWRIICNDLESEYITIKPDAIYLGVNSSGKLAYRLWCIAKTKAIKIFDQRIDPFSDTYKMVRSDISECDEATVKKLFCLD